MENNPTEKITSEQMLAAIYDNSRKTKNYIKWQLIVTVALVVIPFIAMTILIPIIFRSLGSTYGGEGLLQGIQ